MSKGPLVFFVLGSTLLSSPILQLTIDLETLPYRMLIISNDLPITVYRVEDHNNYFRYITGYIAGFHKSSL